MVKNPPAMQETQVQYLGLIPGLGRSPGEGRGYPLQFSGLENFMDCIVHGVAKSGTQLSDFDFASPLVAQTVKNLPAMWETWVRYLGWEDRLEQGMATHSSILAWRIPMDRGAWRTTVHGVAQSQTRLSNQTQHSTLSHLNHHTPLESR